MNRRQALSSLLLAPWGGRALLAGETPVRRLALLFASPSSPGSTAEQEDQLAMYHTLRRRGIASEEICCLGGQVGRASLLNFLRDAAQRMATWPDGQVFLHYSGCGTHLGSGQAVRPALDLASEILPWDEVFRALALPRGVHLTLLPDCCLSNLLTGRLPGDATGLVMAATPGNELKCTAGVHAFHVNGVGVPRGVISYYATQALMRASTAKDWLQKTQALCNDDVARGVLPAKLRLTFALAGSARATLPGNPM